MATIAPLAAVVVLVAAVESSAAEDCLRHLRLGISFPPVRDAEQREFALDHLETLGVETIRFAEDWYFREPSPGAYNWNPLDQRLLWAEANGLSVLLTIQTNGPDWACDLVLRNERSCVFSDLDAFGEFVEALLLRHGERIAWIQFGNEMLSPNHYIGDVDSFLDASEIVYDAVERLSPDTPFVLGGFSSGTVRRYAACRGGTFFPFFAGDELITTPAERDAFCARQWVHDVNDRLENLLATASRDLIDIHLYDDVENWPHLWRAMHDLVPGARPLVTEFGGPNLRREPSDDAYQAERLGQYIHTLEDLGAAEAWFFKLVENADGSDHAESGLIDNPSLEEKPSYDVFRSFAPCPLPPPRRPAGRVGADR